jgi:hypothetical protein
MRSRLKLLFLAFFGSVASLSSLTVGVGVGTIVCTSPALHVGAIIFCVVVVVIAAFAVWYQAKGAYDRLKTEDEDYLHTRSRFDSLTEGQQEALDQIARAKSVDQYKIDVHDSLEATGLVMRDPNGWLFIHPGHAKAIGRLLKERPVKNAKSSK